MNKELEKELMNDVMNSDELQVEPNDIVKILYDIYNVPSGICKQIKDMVQRLEAIDNANPSEALKSLEEIDSYDWSEFNTSVSYDFPKEYNTIKQSLLKAQEQEKVLEIIKEKPIRSGIAIEQIKKQRGLTYSQYKKVIVELSEAYLLTEEEFDLLKRWENGKRI